MSAKQKAEFEKQIAFGVETEAFITGNIGKYLLMRSQMEIDEAVEKLKKVHPWNKWKIRKLQNIIARNENVEWWLREIIHTAIEAREAVEGQEG